MPPLLEGRGHAPFLTCSMFHNRDKAKIVQ